MLNGPVRLWPIQSMAVLEPLEQEGVLRGDPARTDPDLRPACEWMAARLAKRGCRRDARCRCGHGCAGMAARPRPDRRTAGHLPPGTSGMRIAFAMPAAKVLVSDFDAWHAVHNGVRDVPEEADCEAVMQRFERLQGRTGGPFTEETGQGIVPTPPWPDDVSLQAMFGELPKVCIRGITAFVAR